MKWVRGIIAAVILISFYSIIGNMEYRIVQRESEWRKSEQAILMEQEKIQNSIIELQEQYDTIENMYIHQGIHIDNIMTRYNFNLIEDLLETGEIHE